MLISQIACFVRLENTFPSSVFLLDARLHWRASWSYNRHTSWPLKWYLAEGWSLDRQVVLMRGLTTVPSSKVISICFITIFPLNVIHCFRLHWNRPKLSRNVEKKFSAERWRYIWIHCSLLIKRQWFHFLKPIFLNCLPTCDLNGCIASQIGYLLTIPPPKQN